MASHFLTSKCLPVQEDSGIERQSDHTCRQPSNRSETAKGIGIEGQVEEAGVSAGQIQETSGERKKLVLSVNMHVKSNNSNSDFLSMIWKAMQEETLERKRIRQKDERGV